MATKPSGNTQASTPKTTSTKKEFLLFISIPAGIILLVSLFLVVPTYLAKPGYDFIYSHCPDYDCSSRIVVDRDGRAKVTATIDASPDTIPYRLQSLESPEIYYHNTRQNASKRITLAELDSYKLNPSNVSPDGYSLSRGGSDGGFLFWGYSSDDSWYLKKGSLQKKSLNLTFDDYPYSVKLVGWVEK